MNNKYLVLLLAFTLLTSNVAYGREGELSDDSSLKGNSSDVPTSNNNRLTRKVVIYEEIDDDNDNEEKDKNAKPITGLSLFSLFSSFLLF